MPKEHSQFRGIKRSIVGICAAVVICSAGPAFAACDPPYGSIQCDRTEAIADGRIRIGMTDRQFVRIFGAPDHINVTVTPRGSEEQWVYPNDAYAYFSSRVLTSLQYGRR
jgi:hypothetical protein